MVFMMPLIPPPSRERMLNVFFGFRGGRDFGIEATGDEDRRDGLSKNVVGGTEERVGADSLRAGIVGTAN